MNLADAQIAVLAENLYQELELWYPLMRLREAGANVLVVAPAADQVYASKLGYPVNADLPIGDVEAAVSTPSSSRRIRARGHAPHTSRSSTWYAGARSGRPRRGHLPCGLDARLRRHRARPPRHLRCDHQGRRDQCRRRLCRRGRWCATATSSPLGCRATCRISAAPSSPISKRRRAGQRGAEARAGRRPRARERRLQGRGASRMAPRGKASANYTTGVIAGPRA